MKAIFSLALAFSFLTTALAATPDITGQWKWIYERNEQAINIEMHVKQDGSKLTGKLLADGRELPMREGKISGDGLVSFHIVFERDNGPLRIDFQGKAKGDVIAGTTIYTNDQGEKREREWNPKREQTNNLSGKWTSTFKRSDGTPFETTLDLKQTGTTLTGSQSFNDFQSEIRDGKVDGDHVSFRIVGERDGRTVTSNYKGKIQPDKSIKGEIESDWSGEVRQREWEARKAN